VVSVWIMEIPRIVPCERLMIAENQIKVDGKSIYHPPAVTDFRKLWDAMKIRVKLFATFNRFRPGELAGKPFEMEVPDSISLKELINRLNIPQEEVKVCFVNGRAQDLEVNLFDGDEVGIFPPIGGGLS